MRNQIISDYKHGIQNEEYRVLETSNGKFQVRKRTSPFVPNSQSVKRVQIEEPEKETEKEKVEDTSKTSLSSNLNDRMSNEDLLRKLSTLLDVPQKEPEQIPQEHDAEEEAYEQEQNYYNSRANLGMNPYIRQPLRLY